MKRKWYVNLLIGIVFVVLYLFAKALSSIITGMIFESFKGIDKTRLLQIGLIGDIVPILFVLLFARVTFKWKGKDLWLTGPKIKNYFVGYMVGIVLFLGFIIIGVITGNIKYNGIVNISPLDFMLFLVGFAIQSFEEELLSRGFLQRLFKNKWGVIPSILIPSSIFAALHIANKGSTVPGIINVFLVGILFALMVYKTKSLWYAGAAHGAWNFVQGVIFGQKVSGNTVGEKLLDFQVTGTNPLITGGTFGPEGSLIVSFILIIGIVYFWYRVKDKLQEIE